MSQNDCGFAEREQRLRAEWAGSAETQSEWTFVKPVGIGATEPWEADGPGNMRAIVKDAIADDWGRPIYAAAHEKIAADLAFEIGVCVPPVTLWRSPANTLHAISARAYATYENWSIGNRLGLFDAETIAGIGPTLAAGYTFHNWIGDCDHTGGDDNLLISLTAEAIEAPSAAFIDYALSLSHSWSRNGHDLVELQKSYYIPVEELPKMAIRVTLDRINSLSTSMLGDIVARIPQDFLPTREAAVILDGLESRRQPLARLMRQLI